MTYQGSCHCGRTAFEVEGELKQVMECNCSHCIRKGFLLWFLPRDKLRLKTPEANLATYLAFGKDKNGADTACINVRCLEGVDLSAVKRVPFDGRSL